ncbi:TPA: hypothetical protein ACRZH1_003136, partial [Escherichia coli]
MPPEAEHSPAYKEIIHATGKRRKHCDKDGDKERKNKAHRNGGQVIIDEVRVVHAGCGVNALSGLQIHANSIHCWNHVDTVMACKFFPG